MPITRRCVYCCTPHFMGKNYGEPYSDGLCWKAALKEDIKWYTPIWLKKAEQWIAPVALLYLAMQIIRWLIK